MRHAARAASAHHRGRDIGEPAEERPLEHRPHHIVDHARPKRRQLDLGVAIIVGQVGLQAVGLLGHQPLDIAGQPPLLIVGQQRRLGDRLGEVGPAIALSIDQQVGGAADIAWPQQDVAAAELVEQRQRAGIERGQPAGPGVAVVAGAEVLGVGAPADDVARLDHLDAMASLAQPVRGGQASRAGADDSDMHCVPPCTQGRNKEQKNRRTKGSSCLSVAGFSPAGENRQHKTYSPSPLRAIASR